MKRQRIKLFEISWRRIETERTVITIGYGFPRCGQSCLISIVREYLDENYNVEYATMLWNSDYVKRWWRSLFENKIGPEKMA